MFEVGRCVVSRLKEGWKCVRGRCNREAEVLEVNVKKGRRVGVRSWGMCKRK